MRKTIAVLMLLVSSVASARTTHYVDLASGGDGSSGSPWTYTDVFGATTKWCSTESWPKPSPTCDNLIGAGDTVYLDGGTSDNVVYTSQMTIQKSGVSEHPITIAVNPDRSYGVIVDADYTPASGNGFNLGTKKWITLTGEVSGERKIIIRHTGGPGVYFRGAGVTVKYLEIYGTEKDTKDSGQLFADFPSTGWPTLAEPVDISYNYVHDAYGYYKNFEIRGNNYSPTPDANKQQWGLLKFHHNISKNVESPQDHIENTLGGVDIYNNVFYNESPPITNTYDFLHQYVGYVRLWNNEFYGSTTATGNIIYYQPHTNFMPGGTATGGYFVFMNNLVHSPNISTVISGGFRGYDNGGGTANDMLGMNHVFIINNTITSASDSWMDMLPSTLSTSANTDNVFVANNIATGILVGGNPSQLFNAAGTLNYGGTGSGADVIIDHNIGYASSGSYGTSISYLGTTYTWANLKSACTYDGTSCNANDAGSPIDPDLNASYIPNVGSPAIGAGVDMSGYDALTVNGGPCASGCTDKAGVARGTTWDIGAFQYAAGAADTVPNSFTFTDNSEVARSTVIYSTSIQVTGIDDNTSITSSGTNCFYQVNGAGDWLTTGGDNVSLNDNVAMKVTSSANYATDTPCILTLNGNVSDTWHVTTLEAIVDPSSPRLRGISTTGGWK